MPASNVGSVLTKMNAGELLTARETASYIGIAHETLCRWRTHKDGPLGPKFIQQGQWVRYHPHDVQQWLNEKRAA